MNQLYEHRTEYYDDQQTKLIKRKMIESVTDKEYATFIDTGVVSKLLLKTITKKVKYKVHLSPRESAILTDKISEINFLLRNDQTKNKNE